MIKSIHIRPENSSRGSEYELYCCSKILSIYFKIVVFFFVDQSENFFIAFAF